MRFLDGSGGNWCSVRTFLKVLFIVEHDLVDGGGDSTVYSSLDLDFKRGITSARVGSVRVGKDLKC